MARRRLGLVRAQYAWGALLLSMLGVSPCFAQAEEVTELIKRLTSSSSTARTAAAAKVAELGPAAADAAPALIEALKCERIEVLFPSPQIAASRKGFADALIRIGDAATPRLETALAHENGLVRVWAAHALHRIDGERQPAKLIPILTAALRLGNEVAGDAAMVLEQMGEDAVPAIPALIEQLDHRDLATRCGCAHALAAIAKGDQVRHLTAALRHENLIVRVGAAFALHRADAKSPEDVHSVIAAALQDDSKEVRQQAVWAIGQMGVAAQPLAKKLIDALPKLDPDPRAYFFGRGVLGRQATDPSMVLAATGAATKPALIEALDRDHPRIRLMAAVALLRLDRTQAERVAPILKAAREDSDRNVRFLAQMNSPPPPRSETKDLDELVKALFEPGEGIGRRSPATGQLMRRGAEAVAPLMKVLESGDGQAAGRASSILSRLGAPALTALTEAMQSENDQLRVFAISALAAMGEPAVPALVKALRDELYPVRRSAKNALRSIGTPEALEALRKSQGDQ